MAAGPVMIDIDGKVLTDEDREIIRQPLVGGLIFFSRNYESVEQITALVDDIRQLRPDILIAVDQEGGRVQRFKDGFTRLPAMQKFLPLYRKQPQAALSLVQDCGWLMAVELLSVGVDFSFAPVLDVDDNQCAVIADRSFSNNPEEAAELAGAFMRGMVEAGMSTTGKHFPGHGSVTEDSHKELPQDYRSYEELEAHDLIPFKKLLPIVDAVMPAHILFSQIDDSPVGFSPYWLKEILRKQMGFDGVIFSDDLTMEGAAVAGGYGQRAEAALEAGCDMILVCNCREGAIDVIKTLSSREELISISSRIDRMSANKVWAREDLQKNSRYQKIRAVLNVMEA